MSYNIYNRIIYVYIYSNMIFPMPLLLLLIFIVAPQRLTQEVPERLAQPGALEEERREERQGHHQGHEEEAGDHVGITNKHHY